LISVLYKTAEDCTESSVYVSYRRDFSALATADHRLSLVVLTAECRCRCPLFCQPAKYAWRFWLSALPLFQIRYKTAGKNWPLTDTWFAAKTAVRTRGRIRHRGGLGRGTGGAIWGNAQRR